MFWLNDLFDALSDWSLIVVIAMVLGAIGLVLQYIKKLFRGR